MYGSSLLATATCLALAGLSLAFKPFIPEARTESLVIPRQNSRFGVRGLNGHHDDLYNITLFHINDVHAHLDEFRTSGADCTDQTKGCVGGYARVKAQLAQLRPGKKHSLFLNLGDEFQGTLFFTFYGGEKIATTINDMGFDAFIPGNHEFDRGDDYLAEFLKNLTIPVLSANIKTNHTGLKRAMVPYKIFKEHDLAIFGLTTPDTAVTSKPGPGTSFLDPVTIAQATVDEIKKKHRISRIVAMTHIGYSQDMALAANTTGIDIILGGHSHSLLGDMAGAVGKYPTIIKNKDGEDVPVVTSYRWGEYLGYMDLSFNKAGKIVAWTGAPIHLVNTTTPDTAMFNEIKEWRQPFDAYGNQVIGHSDSLLDQTICQTVECNIGDFIADATLAYRRNVSEGVDLCILNAGGIRASIDAGDITIAQVLTTLPFGNLVSDFKLAGSAIWTAIEGVVSKVNQINGNTVTSFIQVSKEVKFTYNPNAAVGSRLVSLEISGEAVTKETTKEYSIVTWDFVATGGDNIFPVQTSFTTLAAQDQAVIQYLQSVPSVNVNTDGRIATVS